MLCAAPDVCLATSLLRDTESDPRLNHWTAVKVILSNQWTKEFFSIMEVVKEFVVKGYVDASFDTNPNNYE